jgi:hypothetical protein
MVLKIDVSRHFAFTQCQIYLIFPLEYRRQCQTEEWASPQWPAVSCNTCYGDTGLIGCAVLVNSIFHTRKTFSESKSAALSRVFKCVRKSCPTTKKFKEQYFNWGEITNVRGEPTYLGWPVRELGEKTRCSFEDTLSTFRER